MYSGIYAVGLHLSSIVPGCQKLPQKSHPSYISFVYVTEVEKSLVARLLGRVASDWEGKAGEKK